jgi:predicted HTH transcriptional regulator
LVKNDINESEVHDFKSGLPPGIELTKDCCAFANSKGGFMILGIGEAGKEFRIKGIDRDKDLANQFGQKLSVRFQLIRDLKLHHSYRFPIRIRYQL